MSWIDTVAGTPRTRLTSSELDADDRVRASPAALLAAARRIDPSITAEEYTAARLAHSEYGRGTPVVHAAVIDAELNRAARKGRTLFSHLCPDGWYGKQGRDGRPASTARDPNRRDLAAARAVLNGPARGVSRGAQRFYDPRTMDVLHRKDPQRVTCDALSLLDRWCYDRRRNPSGAKCPGDPRYVGSQTEAWVGPIDGIDPWDLMLMKPMQPGPEHDRLFRAAAEVIRRGRLGLPTTLDFFGGFDPLLVGAAVLLLGAAIT